MPPDPFMLQSLLQGLISTLYTEIQSLLSRVGSETCASYTEKIKKETQTNHFGRTPESSQNSEEETTVLQKKRIKGKGQQMNANEKELT